MPPRASISVVPRETSVISITTTYRGGKRYTGCGGKSNGSEVAF